MFVDTLSSTSVLYVHGYKLKIISINHLKCVTSLITNSRYWYRMHCVHDQLSYEIVLLTHPSRNLRAAPLRPPRRRVARFESSSSEEIRGTSKGGHSGTSGSWRRRFPSSSSEVLVFTLCDEVVHWSTGWNWTFPALIQSKMVDG